MELQKCSSVALPLKATKALEYLDRNFSRTVTLDDIADTVDMNRCSFCRLSKQSTGMTFTQYLNRLRLEEAKQLLLTSHFYVFQVAHKAGFRNVNYFRILFKKCYGCSPKRYRDGLRPRLGREMLSEGKHGGALQT